ncbi:MAG: transcriptional regulator [Thiothrix sp.]|nr:MAG: transcriptional regulator [Thiothrix sp.]
MTNPVINTIVRYMSNTSIDNIQLTRIFKALSNSHRLEIFRQLTGCCVPGTVCEIDSVNSLCIGELGKSLKIAPSTLSHHVKELNHAGLVRLERHGKRVQCSVDPEILQDLAGFFST